MTSCFGWAREGYKQIPCGDDRQKSKSKKQVPCGDDNKKSKGEKQVLVSPLREG